MKTRSRSSSLNPVVGRGFYKQRIFFVPELVPKSSTDQTDFNVSTSTTKTCITGK